MVNRDEDAAYLAVCAVDIFGGAEAETWTCFFADARSGCRQIAFKCESDSMNLKFVNFAIFIFFRGVSSSSKSSSSPSLSCLTLFAIGRSSSTSVAGVADREDREEVEDSVAMEVAFLVEDEVEEMMDRADGVRRGIGADID